ncbi:hypothetical protein WICPIJ_009220 [Wickerhamomyces pijperi]|uniref:Uncharacterized protein n=1 Tax=Wickerhamomyces pijperi TaxID=599730 RepID=A0A9P8TDV2_WICPI|nr:hypothetical protein WICPIJ_009220 [Wickerhamomyces pijperi]
MLCTISLTSSTLLSVWTLALSLIDIITCIGAPIETKTNKNTAIPARADSFMLTIKRTMATTVGIKKAVNSGSSDRARSILEISLDRKDKRTPLENLCFVSTVEINDFSKIIFVSKVLDSPPMWNDSKFDWASIRVRANNIKQTPNVNPIPLPTGIDESIVLSSTNEIRCLVTSGEKAIRQSATFFKKIVIRHLNLKHWNKEKAMIEYGRDSESGFLDL